MNPSVDIHIPKALQDIFKPARFKVLYGGRGGGKSHSIARALIILSMQSTLRIACARELQTSIKHSVHRLLCDIIIEYNLNEYFKITEKSIICNLTGSFFTFVGLRYNPAGVKSMEGVDICWVEEAENVSKESWDLLTPTIRKQGSEIWISFNPKDEDAPVYQNFVINKPDGAIVIKVNYYDNPFCSDTLLAEMEICKKRDYDEYLHIWEGEPLRISEATIFRGKFEIKSFDIPKDVRWFNGVDWGFSNDPTAITASFIQKRCLYVAYEGGGIELEFDNIADILNSFPNKMMRNWMIKADNARPETISYFKNKGFNISAAKKWKGSLEDGISYLKGFDKIYIHPRCQQTSTEFRLYRYKVDKLTEEVLPIPIDKHNHYIDSIRYALDGYITKKTMSISSKAMEAFV